MSHSIASDFADQILGAYPGAPSVLVHSEILLFGRQSGKRSRLVYRHRGLMEWTYGLIDSLGPDAAHEFVQSIDREKFPASLWWCPDRDSLIGVIEQIYSTIVDHGWHDAYDHYPVHPTVISLSIERD